MRTVAAAAALALCAAATAAETTEVTGAFGYEFGQVVDPAQLKPLNIEPEGGLRYGFIPGNPYDPLTEYELALTPQTMRVYQITARGTFKSMDRCREELDRLDKALERKYARPGGKVSQEFTKMPEIKFGSPPRRVHGICVGAILQKTLTLTYTDEDLMKAAHEEAAAAKGQAAPGAGAGGAGRDESGL